MAVDLTGLRDAVSHATTVDSSAAALIRGIAQLVKDAIAADDIADAENINALAAQLETGTVDLAGAVSENTPAPPAPEPTPEPTSEG